MLQENSENEGISPLKSDTVGVHHPHGRIIKKVIIFFFIFALCCSIFLSLSYSIMNKVY